VTPNCCHGLPLPPRPHSLIRGAQVSSPAWPLVTRVPGSLCRTRSAVTHSVPTALVILEMASQKLFAVAWNLDPLLSASHVAGITGVSCSTRHPFLLVLRWLQSIPNHWRLKALIPVSTVANVQLFSTNCVPDSKHLSLHTHFPEGNPQGRRLTLRQDLGANLAGGWIPKATAQQFWQLSARPGPQSRPGREGGREMEQGQVGPGKPSS
jgi:hypothetical protein